MTHYTEKELDQAEERRVEKEGRKRRKKLREQAKELGVSVRYLESTQIWVQEGRAPTVEEYTAWARSQHKRACKAYQAAYPVDYHRGKCQFLLSFKRPCVAFFSHTGICETGYFVPERMHNLLWTDFNKNARKAGRDVKKILQI